MPVLRARLPIQHSVLPGSGLQKAEPPLVKACETQKDNAYRHMLRNRHKRAAFRGTRKVFSVTSEKTLSISIASRFFNLVANFGPLAPDTMSDILLIEDDELFRTYLGSQLTKAGYGVTSCATLREGLRTLCEHSFDLALVDLQLPDGNSLEHLSSMLGKAEVIVISSDNDPAYVRQTIEAGALDYLVKPVTPKVLQTLVARVLERGRLRRARGGIESLERGEIIGDSAGMQECLRQVAKAAPNDINVLITGETGTGKELFARAIHANSPRADGNFVVVDCTNIPADLVESILFGHKRESFTGAKSDREGLFSAADGDTVFLDEIGDLPLETQKSLLRVLQEKRFRPVGSSTEISSDFRIIAATNQDLKAMVDRGEFRSDLYYRLNGAGLHLPPLRERPEDLGPLIRHHVDRICAELGYLDKKISKDFESNLKAYPWPGNVRELVNMLYRAVTDARDEPCLYPHHIPRALLAEIRTRLCKQEGPGCPAHHREPSSSGGSTVQTGSGPLDDLLSMDPLPELRTVRAAVLDHMEAQYTAELMTQCNGNVAQACRISGLSRARIYQLMKKHGLNRHATVPAHLQTSGN